MGKKLTYKEAKEYTEKAVKLYTGEESLSSKRRKLFNSIPYFCVDDWDRTKIADAIRKQDEEAVARLKKFCKDTTYDLKCDYVKKKYKHGEAKKWNQCLLQVEEAIEGIFGDQLCGSGDKLT